MTDDALHIVERVQAAGSGRAIAALLLRVPDAIVLSHGRQLGAESKRKSFVAGKVFLELRLVALLAVRDAHGLMPTSMSLELEAWRLSLSSFVAGGELPAFLGDGDGATPRD